MAGSPQGSRGGTPTPGSRASKNGDLDDDDDDDSKPGGVRKKVLKRGLKQSLKKEDRPSKLGNGKASPASAKKPSKGDVKSEKRDRDDMDDDEDGTPLRKRMKMQRVGSTTSLHTSIAGEESVDGSFVDDNDSADD